MRSWPLFELRLTTPRLVLRLPTDAELDVIARRAVGQVLPPEQADFMTTAWTQLPSPEFERSFMQFHWRVRSAWTPEAWNLDLAAFADGEPIGCFGLMAEAFAERATVATGSWLLPAWRGRGLGVEGRAAVLALAFEQLGARVARSGAHEDNAASLGVSDALGYERVGCEAVLRPSGRTVREIRVELAREEWERRERPRVAIDGLAPCRELFGVA
jgi:RimJ/RimL family protein N-acetyltransferase